MRRPTRSAAVLPFILSLILIPLLLPSAPAMHLRAASNSLYERSAIGVVGVDGDGLMVAGIAADGTPLDIWLEPDERVIVLGRIASSGELYVQTREGYGTVLADQVRLEGDLARVPVLASIPETAPGLPAAVPVDDPARYPIQPAFSDYVRAIYQRGQAAGNRPDVFSKAGDCLTADRNLFLGRFGMGRYELGDYDELQPVIRYFTEANVVGGQNPLWRQSVTTDTGYTVLSVVDPMWADARLCQNGETALACEFRIAQPAAILIMFGTNDIGRLTPTQYDFFMRLVVHESIAAGVIPLLSTFPGDPTFPDRTHLFNQIVYGIGRDYDVPVMNLWLALQPLPNHGRNPGTVYLSWLPEISTARFTPVNLRFGHTLRNLITLQLLDRLWREVLANGL